MKLSFFVLVLLGAALNPLRAAAQDDAAFKIAAQKSAETWLGMVDSGKYEESWQSAAKLFKASVSKKQWEMALLATRSPLGKVLSRNLKSATYAKNLPGAPDGQYVVIQYETSFEHKQTAIETITPKLEDDGVWRVSGYFIK